MHRTLPWRRALLPGALAALLVAGAAGTVRGQLCSPESRPLIVFINGTTRLQMSTKRPFKSIYNPKDALLTVNQLERDPSTLLLSSKGGAGFVRLEMEDIDGVRETRDVVIQADVEYVTSQIRRAIPFSGINVIPNGANSVILGGFVSRAEDITLAQQIAQAAGFTVLNGMRLGGVQQVQLDVVVARVNRSKGRSFGFNFLANARQNILGSLPGSIPGQIAGVPVGVPSPALQPTQFGQIIAATPSNATIFGGIIGNAGGFLAFLQALETEGLAKLLSQPRLTAQSGNQASFLDGGEQAVPVPAGLGQVGVQFEEFGTRLNFLPVVLGGGRIHLEVEPEVSVLDAASGTAINGTVVPGRVTQRVHTTIELESGQTFAIGGLIQRTSVANANKVPVLGQLPFVGAFFSQKSFTEVETELVILVTPHLVDAQSAAQVVKVLPGQETRTPDDFELFLEGILEAPRGPRAVFVGNRYVPAHRNGPTADLFPCAGRTDGLINRPTTSGSHHGHGGNGCAQPSSGGFAPIRAPEQLPVAPVQPTGSGAQVHASALGSGHEASRTIAPVPLGGALSAETPAETRPIRLPEGPVQHPPGSIMVDQSLPPLPGGRPGT